MRQIASSPVVRDAILQQTTGFFEDVLGIVRASAVQLDDRVERAVRRRERPERTVFAGIVTRALALAVDVAATIGIHLLLVAVVALVASLVGGLRPQWLVGMLIGLAWILIAGGYFVLFWSTTGQTPGMRLFRLRVPAGAPSRRWADRSCAWSGWCSRSCRSFSASHPSFSMSAGAGSRTSSQAQWSNTRTSRDRDLSHAPG